MDQELENWKFICKREDGKTVAAYARANTMEEAREIVINRNRASTTEPRYTDVMFSDL